jgi:hypothetical protein
LVIHKRALTFGNGSARHDDDGKDEVPVDGHLVLIARPKAVVEPCDKGDKVLNQFGLVDSPLLPLRGRREPFVRRLSRPGDCRDPHGVHESMQEREIPCLR